MSGGKHREQRKLKKKLRKQRKAKSLNTKIDIAAVSHN